MRDILYLSNTVLVQVPVKLSVEKRLTYREHSLVRGSRPLISLIPLASSQIALRPVNWSKFLITVKPKLPPD